MKLRICPKGEKNEWSLPSRDSSASLRGSSSGLTPAGDPRMSGRAFLLPERPEEAKSSTGSTSVIPGPLNNKEGKQGQNTYHH